MTHHGVKAEGSLGGARFLYRFAYAEQDDAARSKSYGLQGSRFFAGLLGFSGSAMKSSSILERVLSWDLVPLKGRFAFVEPRCKIMLSGVP